MKLYLKEIVYKDVDGFTLYRYETFESEPDGKYILVFL